MSHVIVRGAAVHTVAAACDFIDEHLLADRLTIVAQLTDDTERDAAAAANVDRVRLPSVTVETRVEPGEPMTLVQKVHENEPASLLIVGHSEGVPESETGSNPEAPAGTENTGLLAEHTVRAIQTDRSIPVLILPVDATTE